MITEHDLERIYRELIAPTVFPDPAPQGSPVAVSLGGQPGSGKTRAAITAAGLSEFPVYPIIGDTFRQFHPDYDQLMTSDPLSMPDATAEASSYWVRKALADARERRIGVLVEGTFRRPSVTLDTCREFRDAGYRVHLIALAVPAWQSRLGTLDRYVGDLVSGNAARWTPLAAHDAGYRGTPRTIRAVIDAGIVDRVTILDRGSAILHDEQSPSSPKATLAALEHARSRIPDRVELEQFSTRLHSNARYLEQHLQLDERTLPLINSLRQDEQALLDQFPPRSLASRIAQLRTVSQPSQTEPPPIQRSPGPQL